MNDAPGFTVSNGPDELVAETARLSGLSPLEYDRERVAAAERLGVRVSTLDTQVSKLREPVSDTRGRMVALPEHEPWPTPICLADVLNEIADAVLRHVIVSLDAATVLAIWAAHTWCFERFDHTPRLSVTSPTKRCGKSTLLDVLALTCRHTLRADNISAAGTFRAVEALSPLTLLIDEADALFSVEGRNEDLRGILNSGFAIAGSVIRIVEIKGEFQPVAFRTFAPAALAAIGGLPGTIEDRAVPIVLQRKASGEMTMKLRMPGARTRLHDLGRKLARWSADAAADLSPDPVIPDAMGDRQGDIAVALLAVADAAGRGWPDRARSALLTLFGSRAATETGTEKGVLLLGDLRAIFGTRDRVPTAELIEKLAGMDNRPWPEWRAGKPITPVQLAAALRPFGVKPTTIRFTDAPSKGYTAAAFADAWTRYGSDLPPSSPKQGGATRNASYSVDTKEENGNSDPLQADLPVTAQNSQKWPKTGLVTGVTGQQPPARDEEGYAASEPSQTAPSAADWTAVI